MTSDTDNPVSTSRRLGWLILCTLRLTVALQCVGNWRWLVHIEETPLLHWMLGPTDVGGLAWSEPTALSVQQTVGWLVFVAAPWVLWRPQIMVLAPLVLLQVLITVAMWRTAEGFALQSTWAPPALLTLFPFATQAVRMVAPLGLLLLSPLGLGPAGSESHRQRRRWLRLPRLERLWRDRPQSGRTGRPRPLAANSLRLPSNPDTVAVTMQLLRWAAAIVFFAHGLEAWQHNPKFVDLLINATQAVLGTRISQSTAQQCLTAIGVVDMLLALACVSFRWLPVLWWMAIWGGATAITRVVSSGWEISGHEALTRIPHLGVPLAVALWWHLLKCHRTITLAVDDNIHDTTAEDAEHRNRKTMPRSSPNNKPLLCVAFLLAVVVNGQHASRAQADAVLEGTNPCQWRLVWTSDPATSATLCWNTRLPGKQHRLYLRQERLPLNQQEVEHQGVGQDRAVVTEAKLSEPLVVGAQRNGRYSAASPELFFHQVQLRNLEPATKYHVVLESDGQQSPAMFFVTAPDKDVPVSLLFGADSRSGLQARRQMNAMMAQMLAESYAAGRVPILALAHGGDFIRDGRELDQWSQWMSDHELTVTAAGRLLPIIPARGNHDGGKLFNEVFGFPPQHTNYYSVDLGPQLRLITLNTETSMSGDQRDWLEAELAASRSKKRWLLAQYHRPAFPAVKVPGLNLVHWVPLFETHHVDLVCEGDGHNIKRTAPIRDFHIDPTGVVYIGEGGLGVGQRTPKTGRWYLNSSQAKTGQGHHVQLLTFDQTQLRYRVVLLGGKVFDEHYRPVRRLPASAAVE